MMTFVVVIMMNVGNPLMVGGGELFSFDKHSLKSGANDNNNYDI